MVYPLENHLLDLFLKYQEGDLSAYRELGFAIDKIIWYVLGKQKTLPIYHPIETEEDLVQDLRLMCLKKLNNLKPPYTNKRIFNYLRVCVSLKLLEKYREVGRKLDKNRDSLLLTYEPGIRRSSSMDEFSIDMLTIENKTTQEIARLLSLGVTKEAIKQQLNMTQAQLNKGIEELRERYKDSRCR